VTLARPDHSLAAFAAALRRAVTGDDKEARLVAADEAVAVLGALLGQRKPKSRRGRRPVHDPEWAIAQLTGLAASVDGLPEDQTSVIKWLAERFEDSGRPVPCDTWLKGVDREFRGKIALDQHESRSKFHASTSLQAAFQNEDAYLKYCAARTRLEQRWLHDKHLQVRFPSPSDYVASELMRT
jgi:hypothetical protein